MIRNEKGFSYPLTFCVILLAFVVLSIHLELYISEKRIINETVTMLKQEYYFLSAMKWTEEQLLVEENEGGSGIYSFLDGEVNYHSVKVTDSLLRVTFVLTMKDSPEITGVGYYDKELKKMIKWNEKN
ncbi:competence type IV pilus minor pilin ComGG [Cytobacillus massiliigabonensis]|uniref:competence type IV pilus minor pilin ComGG n=1 Tax=Cytobacillus massiliigabonensis TaxID=1871011 RepID=UPI000C8624C9|nr:competence type IV pilus minor pilin ComGG [Cytobacillus massiliigabonensis]